MCQKCLDAVKKHYPDLNEEEAGELLMSATCFPFGQPEQVEAQLAELKEKTDGSLGGALAFAQDEMDKSMREFRKASNVSYTPK